MSGDKIMTGMREAISVARGDVPAARIWHNGHAYVPETSFEEIRDENRRLWDALVAMLASKTISTFVHRSTYISSKVLAAVSANKGTSK